MCHLGSSGIKQRSRVCATGATHPKRSHALRPIDCCADRVKHAALVVRVQERGQLVQKQHLGKNSASQQAMLTVAVRPHLRLLGERAGDRNTLLLPAAERVHRPQGEPLHAT